MLRNFTWRKRAAVAATAAAVAASTLAVAAPPANAIRYWADGTNTTAWIIQCGSGSPNKYINLQVMTDRPVYGVLEDPVVTHVRLWVYDRWAGSTWVPRAGPTTYQLKTGYTGALFQKHVYGLSTTRYVWAEYWRWINGTWHYHKEFVGSCYL